MAGVGFHRVQGNEQPLADLLVGTTLGNQLEHGQLAATQGFAAADAGAWYLRQALEQLGLHRAGGNSLELFEKPLRVLLQQRLERLQHAALGCHQQPWQQLGGLLFPTFAQQQAKPLAHGTDAEHHAATGLAALDQAGQALRRVVATRLDTLERCLLQGDVQRQQRVELRAAAGCSPP